MFFARSNIDRQDFCWKILIPYYQNLISCFLVDIGPILPKIHSCFLVEIGPLPKILRNLLDGSSSCFGACYFQKMSLVRIQVFEIYKNSIQKEIHLSYILKVILVYSNSSIRVPTGPQMQKSWKC